MPDDLGVSRRRRLVGLVAGAVLAIDYILNVAVGISAGVGALVSWSKMTLAGLKFALRRHLRRAGQDGDRQHRGPLRQALDREPGAQESHRAAQARLARSIAPDRDVAVVIPDLITSHWYEGLLHNNRGTFLRMILRAQCSDRVVVISTPFHLRD